MIRFLFLAILGLAFVTLVTRARGPRRILIGLLGLMILYTVLKLSGVIDAGAPDRIGVF